MNNISLHITYHRNCTVEKIMNDLLLVTDNQQLALMGILDLTAAFDTVDHSMLLKKLQSMIVVHVFTLVWFGSCQIGTVMSKESGLKCRVSKGYVLGPHLYSDYTIPPVILIRHFLILFICMPMFLNCIGQYLNILMKTT